MSNFRTDAPLVPPKDSWRITRTPSSSSITLDVITPRPLYAPVHYWRGRSVVCSAEEGCDPCAAGRRYRWLGWVLAIDRATNEAVIFEFTSEASKILTQYLQEMETLRGSVIKAHRPSGRANGRIHIQIKPSAAPLGVCVPTERFHARIAEVFDANKRTTESPEALEYERTNGTGNADHRIGGDRQNGTGRKTTGKRNNGRAIDLRRET